MTVAPPSGACKSARVRDQYKPLVGALAMMAAMTAGVVACAEIDILPRANFGGKTGPAREGELFVCPNPYHHDGDAIRCGDHGRSDRFYAIDAPEMPGACRPGRECTPGDPFAARDHLRALTAGKSVECRQVDTDRYGRRVLQCFAGGVDLSCAMVRDGFAAERYERLRC